jgi:hypothetical protein
MNNRLEHVFVRSEVSKHWKALRMIWEPFARKAVDKALVYVEYDCDKCRGKKFYVKKAQLIIPDRPDNIVRTVIVCKKCKNPEVLCKHHPVYDDLEANFWEQDVGWEYSKDAYVGMAKWLGMIPDKEIEDSPLADVYDSWGRGWNKYQENYAMSTYGLDITFGNY